MALNSVNKIVQLNWDLTPMLDTLIARVNILVSNQPKLLTFTDMHGPIIGDVETPVLGSNLDEGEVEFPKVDAKNIRGRYVNTRYGA